jgi:hypothetical protein
MSRIRYSLPIALGLFVANAVANAVSAHDTLPSTWCVAPNTRPVATAQFVFTPAQLAAYRDAHDEESGSVDGTQCDMLKTCGIVDDWFWANRMAHDYCDGGLDAGAARSGLVSKQPPMPFVSSPADYNARDHHALYRFSDGNLVGLCVACPTVAQPVEDLPSK